VDTGKKSVDETVSDIIALAHNTAVLALFSKLALNTLNPDEVASLANRRAVISGVNYAQRLEEIIAIECGETSLFTPEDVRNQCSRDPGLVHALVNKYDNLHDGKSPMRLRLVVEGESKQIYKVETPLTRHWDNHVLVFLKPTIYSHSKQATAEIEGLSAIRASGSRLFLEMLHRAGISHTYNGLNAHGLIWAHSTEITMIETVYKELCLGTDKHSFFGMANDSSVTLSTGQYRRGPYVRFDWRNPNHTYKGVNPATHPFYHLMEASIGKDVFYEKYLTARAKPFGDKCVPEELVHNVQDVEASVDSTIRIFFTIQHYLHQIGLEVQDGCIMLDPKGRTMWSEINQDCMRLKRREIMNANGQETFDKDIWRAGGSSVKVTILDKFMQLNNLLRTHLVSRPFHEHEMVAPCEPYGLHARQVLADNSLTLTPRYQALYERLAAHDRSGMNCSTSAMDLFTKADADADAPPVRAATRPGSKAIGVTADKYRDRTDEFMLIHLGVKLLRPEGRYLRVDYEIVDAAKFATAFGEGVSVHFVSARPKDMPGLIGQGTLDGTVTYNVVMDDFPTVAQLVTSLPATDISLALISRRGQKVDPQAWTADHPARIVAEHPRMVRTYLASLGVSPDTYKIQRVLGASESYLVNDPCKTYLLCDAIVITGSTLEANHLEVWRNIRSKGDVAIGLYQRLDIDS
jgi:hypothetical protein